MTKIIHVTTVPQSLGFLKGQIGYIKRRGFDVQAISSAGVQLAKFGRTEDIAVYEVELPRRITPLQDVRAVWKLARILRDIRPAIVHSHTPKGGLLGMIAAWITRTPVRIYHMRGLPYMSAKGMRRLLLMATDRVSCGLAHRVFCVSHSLREVAIDDHICPADKIVVFGGGSGNGVDAIKRFNPERFSTDDREANHRALGILANVLVVGFVGRIVRDKGIEELAHAWLKIREAYPETRLLVAGVIESQDPVSSEVLGLLQSDPRVIMPGRMDARVAYTIIDILVLPTYREGFPNVPLEAAAMELPVVATRIPGCIDAVRDGVTGTLVPVRDADALRAAIQMYLDDPDLRRQHGLAGRERVLRDFRQEVIWEAVYQEYCRLLEEKGLPIPTPRDAQ